MSFTNYGLIKRSSATQTEQPKQPIINKSESPPNNLLPLVGTGDKAILSPLSQNIKEHNDKNLKEKLPKDSTPSGFVPEQ
jgi:hypothetical protein